MIHPLSIPVIVMAVLTMTIGLFYFYLFLKRRRKDELAFSISFSSVLAILSGLLPNSLQDRVKININKISPSFFIFISFFNKVIFFYLRLCSFPPIPRRGHLTNVINNYFLYNLFINLFFRNNKTIFRAFSSLLLLCHH